MCRSSANHKAASSAVTTKSKLENPHRRCCFVKSADHGMLITVGFPGWSKSPCSGPTSSSRCHQEQSKTTGHLIERICRIKLARCTFCTDATLPSFLHMIEVHLKCLFYHFIFLLQQWVVFCQTWVCVFVVFHWIVSPDIRSKQRPAKKCMAPV